MKTIQLQLLIITCQLGVIMGFLGGGPVMDDIEVSAQAKQAAMLAVMAAGDASNDKAWRNRVQVNIGKFAALVRNDYGYWGREAQGIMEAAVFRAAYVGSEMEETSKRLIVTFQSDTTAKADADDDGMERIRTERTDTPPGWHMQRLINSLEPGQEVIVWKKVEAISGSKKVRVLVHLEQVRSKSDGEARTPARPSGPSRPEEGGPSPSGPSGVGTAPGGATVCRSRRSTACVVADVDTPADRRQAPVCRRRHRQLDGPRPRAGRPGPHNPEGGNEMSGHPLGPAAVDLFQWAIRNGSAGVLLEHLFEGGGVTKDADRGWVLIPAFEIERLAGEPEYDG